MKQKERHHLKENELAHGLSAASATLAGKKTPILAAAVIVGVVVVGAVGYAVVRQQASAKRAEMLSAAMTIVDAPVQPPNPAVPPTDGRPGKMAEQQPGTYPTAEAKLTAAIPKLVAVADAYPDADAGLLARFRLAQAYAELGKHAEAAAAFDRVIAQGGTSLHARMARLGKANALARMGQHAAAIATYKEIADAKDSPLPADAVLMELGTTYAAAGNLDEAKKTFSRIVHEHPASPYATEAGKQIQ